MHVGRVGGLDAVDAGVPVAGPQILAEADAPGQGLPGRDGVRGDRGIGIEDAVEEDTTLVNGEHRPRGTRGRDARDRRRRGDLEGADEAAARALRRLKPDPIPTEIVTKILTAATSAPSGGNRQDWLFVAITAPEQRRRVGDVYAKASQLVRPFYSDAMRPAHMSADEFRRKQSSGFYLTNILAMRRCSF